MPSNWDGGPIASTGCDDQWAFCDTFEEGASGAGGRTGDLDAKRWSVGRTNPTLPTAGDRAFWVGPGTVPACRAGSKTSALPDDDVLICDPVDTIRSHYLLSAVASQNYGVNSFRIRQPFDFADRTGKIVFDTEAYVLNDLLGWVSLEIAGDPTPTLNFMPDERGLEPKNGVALQFMTCAPTKSIGVRHGRSFANYVETVLMPSFPATDNEDACVSTSPGKLNHFEVQVSPSKLAVYASNVSEDGGVTFPPTRLIYGVDLTLPFVRGYVSVTGHNHATIKYSKTYNANVLLDDWLVRWDNVGFDGPRISNWREYSFPDALTVGHGEEMAVGVNVGYRVPDVAKAPLQLQVGGVDPTAVAHAELTFTAYYLVEDDPAAAAKFILKYRINGKAWHDRPLTPDELAVLRVPGEQGAVNQVVELTVSELQTGTNTFEFQTASVPQNYPPALANMDLVLTTQ